MRNERGSVHIILILSVVLLLVAGVVGYMVYAYKGYKMTASQQLTDEDAGVKYSIKVPSKLKRHEKAYNTFFYSGNDSYTTSDLVVIRVDASTAKIEDAKSLIAANKITNHTMQLPAKVPFGYKYGADLTEDITINGQKGIYTEATYKLTGAPYAIDDTRVLSVSYVKGNGMYSFWLGTNDSAWANPKQGLIDIATSLKEE